MRTMTVKDTCGPAVIVEPATGTGRKVLTIWGSSAKEIGLDPDELANVIRDALYAHFNREGE